MTLRLLTPLASLLLVTLAVIPSDAAAQDVRPRPHITRKAQAPPPPGATTSRRDPNSPDSPSRQGGNQSGGQNQQQAELVVETSHPYWLEAVIFCGLAGGALFLICRSAGRV